MGSGTIAVNGMKNEDIKVNLVKQNKASLGKSIEIIPYIPGDKALRYIVDFQSFVMD